MDTLNGDYNFLKKISAAVSASLGMGKTFIQRKVLSRKESSESNILDIVGIQAQFPEINDLENMCTTIGQELDQKSWKV